MLKSLALTSLTIAVIGKFFLSSFLGVFGYSAIPIERLQKLNTSKQVVDKMKSRHKTKKINASKKFYKKAGAKVSATAISAATLGTIAVVGTLTYLEVSQYCEEQKELVEEGNILFSSQQVFDNQACLSQAKEDSLAITDEALEVIKTSSIHITDQIIEGANDVLESSREELIKVFEYIDDMID